MSRGVRAAHEPTPNRLEIVRRLGTGSYAVVYLVREVLEEAKGDDLEWELESEDGIVGLGSGGGRGRQYGREFALKCLSKHDLSDDSLEVQMFEATVHQSLAPHSNIVTLYETLQTPEWLFLVLELCPGEDLFYWLERSKPPPSITTGLAGAPAQQPADPTITPLNPAAHHGSAPSASHLTNHSLALNISTPSFPMTPPSSSLLLSSTVSAAFTPPTPSLLSTLPATLLLAPHRVRLIISMFSQMCSAVQACHDVGVSHRDIKPENIIVTETKNTSKIRGRVVCKLTDFGLATTDGESEDVECGSRPYMAVECRNNLGPSYRPPPADVWSLGIVLINMLFHKNPWSDPSPSCVPFQSFRQDPKGFLSAKFPGMGDEVAEYLATKVLAWDPESRVSAGEFGKWVKGLGHLLGGSKSSLKFGGAPGGEDDKGRRPPTRNAFQIEKKKVERYQPTTSSLFAKSPIMPRLSFGDSLSVDSASPGPMETPLSSPSPPPTLTPALATFSSETAESSKSSFSTPTPETASAVSLPKSSSLTHTPIAETPITITPSPMPLSEVNLPPASGLSPDLLSPTDIDNETDDPNDGGENSSRTPSVTSKRRKRGVRKGKAALLAASGGQASTEDQPSAPASAPAPPAATSLSLAFGNKEATSRALALASQTLAREISAMTNPRPMVCVAPPAFNAFNFPPPSAPGPSRKTLSGGSTATLQSQARAASATRRQSELESLNAIAKEREDAAALPSLGVNAFGPWHRGRPSSRDGADSPLRLASPSNSTHSSIGSDSASWRNRGVSPSQSQSPHGLTSHSQSDPIVPTRRDAGSGGVPGRRRVLVARRATDAPTASGRAVDVSPAASSARTSLSMSPPSSVYSGRSDTGSISTYATSASSAGSNFSYQPSSKNSSMYSAGGTPMAPKRQTNVKQMSGLPYQLDQLPRHHHMTRSGELSTSDDIFTKPRDQRPPKVKQPKPVIRQQAFSSSSTPQLSLDTISEKPKLASSASSTTGTGSSLHRPLFVVSSSSSMKDASTGDSFRSGPQRVLTPRRGVTEGPPRPNSPTSSVASSKKSEHARPAKLKAQIGSLKSMLVSGLKPGGKK